MLLRSTIIHNMSLWSNTYNGLSVIGVCPSISILEKILYYRVVCSYDDSVMTYKLLLAADRMNFGDKGLNILHDVDKFLMLCNHRLYYSVINRLRS